jgi:hypothetical protein
LAKTSQFAKTKHAGVTWWLDFRLSLPAVADGSEAVAATYARLADDAPTPAVAMLARNFGGVAASFFCSPIAFFGCAFPITSFG